MSLMVDTWQATTNRHIQTIQAGILDVIDIGVTGDVFPDPHTPSEKEIHETDRADGMFRSTPVGTSRPSGVSRPTERRVIVAENEAQAVTTALLRLCSEAQTVVDVFELQVYDEDGDPLELVVPYQRYEEATYTRDARWVVDLSPRKCRKWTVKACVWLGAVVDAMADHWQGAEPDAMPSPYGHAKWLGGKIEGLSKRVRPERPVQKPLVHCRHHPGKLAKYRKAMLCEPCYRAERKTA